jgi:hypothetical protein
MSKCTEFGHTFPTEGNPMSATLASPDFCTSKPVPAPPDLATGSSNWARYLASLAFKRPRWYSVAYLGVVWVQKFRNLDGSSLPYFSVLMRVEQDRLNDWMIHYSLRAISSVG